MTDVRATLAAPHAFAEHEHRELRPRLARLHETALGAYADPSHELAWHLASIAHWIDEALLPHLAWEEAEIFTAIDGATGTPWATRTVRHEHARIRAAANAVLEARVDLARHEPSRLERAELAGRLFAFEALLRGHLEREEDELLPVLAMAAAGIR